LDEAFFAGLKKRIDDALLSAGGKPGKLVLDISTLERLSSSDLGEFLRETDRVTSLGGTVKLVNASPLVLEILELVGVRGFFEIDRDGSPLSAP
jgi:anti-anti-sigma factor